MYPDPVWFGRVLLGRPRLRPWRWVDLFAEFIDLFLVTDGGLNLGQLEAERAFLKTQSPRAQTTTEMPSTR